MGVGGWQGEGVARRLALFPLGTVLYPGLVLPLHVFEARYRALVRDLAEAPEDDRGFGVVAIRRGHEVGAEGVRALYAVGCLAQLRQVRPYADGRFDLVTTGGPRFRIGSLDADSAPYLQADVDLLDEPDGAAAGPLAHSVAGLWQAYRQALAAGAGSPEGLAGAPELAADPSGDPARLSYLVAAGSTLDLADKQRLLEEPDTTGRLRRELAILRRETALLRLLPSLPAVELVHQEVSPN